MTTTEDIPMGQQLLDEPLDTATGRVGYIDEVDALTGRRVQHLVALARRGLRAAYLPATAQVAHTVRAVAGAEGVHLQQEGTNLRYAAIAALGLARLPLAEQQEILSGSSAGELTAHCVQRAQRHPDLGAVALSAWAAAEAGSTYAEPLFDRLAAALHGGRPLAAVELSWTLTAAASAAGLDGTGDATADLLTRAATRLVQHQSPSGLFTHVLPSRGVPRWRAHVGSFADQVYPLQALARAARHTGSKRLLRAAERTASRICALQGPAGQWWWHYDSRTGGVVERYPVYSVHQHAMAPMVLMDLWEAGGADHRAEVAAGLAWFDHNPEVVEELRSDRFGLVWRKVGRREPPKAARAVGAATTSLWPGARVPALDRLLPPVVVDHECRPYELGWLLHAWLPPTTPGSGTGSAPVGGPRG